MTTVLLSNILSHATASDVAGMETRGALFLGLEVNYLLWGVQITQSYHYYKSYRKTDSRWTKTSVALLLIVDTLQTIFASIFCWRFLVQGMIVGPQTRTGWEIDMVPILDAITASIVHITYAQRIWLLLRGPYNYICAATVLALSSAQFAAGFGSMIFASVSHLTFAQTGRLKTWGSVWLITAAVTDIVITMIMTWWLTSSRTGIKKTDDILSKLTGLIIETGLATSVAQIVDFVLFIVLNSKPFHMTVVLFIPKLYSNSMLALLNSRKPRNTSETCSFCQSKAASALLSMDTVILQRTHMIGASSDSEQGDRKAYHEM